MTLRWPPYSEAVPSSPYDSFAVDYHWILPDTQVSGQRFREHYGPVLEALEPGAEILDCACGVGFDAMALARLGYRVSASDASEGMVERARQSITEANLQIPVVCCPWDQLPTVFRTQFDAVFCLGNSISHAPSADAMLRAFVAMHTLLRPGGLVVVESRDWEQMRAERQRLEVRDHVAVRDNQRGLCVFVWTIPEHWDEPHVAEIIVLIERDGTIAHRLVELRFLPHRLDEMLDLMAEACFEDCQVTRPRSGRYVVSARKG
jgi:SAM-dependent methyltransferase